MKMNTFNLGTILLVTLCASVISGSGVPIWELLTEQEKMSRLMYLFLRLVDSYCKSSPIPDCNKVLALYGVSNLVTQDEDTINRLDPFQRGARQLIWTTVMKGAFHLPAESYQDNRIKDYNFDPSTYISNGESYVDRSNIGSYTFPDLRNDIGESDPHPYAVRVKPPKGFNHQNLELTKNSQSNFPIESHQKLTNEVESFQDGNNEIRSARFTSQPSSFDRRMTIDNYRDDSELMYPDDTYDSSVGDYSYDYSYINEPLPQNNIYSNSPIIRIVPFKSSPPSRSTSFEQSSANSRSANSASFQNNIANERRARYNTMNNYPSYSIGSDRRSSDLLRILKR